MRRLNMDGVSAIVLLLFTGAMFYASFAIEVTDYSTMQPSVWPRIILAALAIGAALLLVRSAVVPAKGDRSPAETASGGAQSRRPGLAEWFRPYVNPLLVFVLFLAFVATLRWLGMLLGGFLFVFLALTLTGRNDARSIFVHLAVAALSVGGMWAIFTFAIGVILPAGEVLPRV